MTLEWLGHAGFRLSNEVVVYIDPYNIDGGPKADLILLTHPHFDHCSFDDIEQVRKDDTTILCPEECGVPGDLRIIRSGDSLELASVAIQAVPAYNIDKSFHPPSKGYVGYIITMDGQRIYHAGDTDLIPEMSGIDCDIALLPVSGTYVMSAKEAAKAASQIQPKLAIPMHYGAGVIGTVEDAQEFERLADVPVEVREIPE